MATQTLISIEEYLRTTSDPDCEYVRGEIVQRAMPAYDHAEWQKILITWFANHEREWGIRALPELRVQVDPNEFRIPDVTILARTAPREQIITHPPLAVFEILSPSDTMKGMLDKLEAYQRMGIPAIWVIDPQIAPKVQSVTGEKTGVTSMPRNPGHAATWLYSSGHLTPANVFELPGTAFRVSISEIAALLD